MFDPEVLTRARYWIAVPLAISLPGAIAYWFVIHPFAGFWQRRGVRTTFGVVMTALALSILFLFLQRDRLLGQDLGFHPAFFALGVVFYACGVGLQARVGRQLSRRTLIGVPEVSGEGGELITTGLYSRTRNPRYLVIFLVAVGVALSTNYAGVWLQAAILCPAIYLVVLLEERELRVRFGEPYLDYCRRVPRFVPRLGALDSEGDG